jgi:hypothetical protein
MVDFWNEMHLLAEKHSAQHTLLLAASRRQAVIVKTPKILTRLGSQPRRFGVWRKYMEQPQPQRPRKSTYCPIRFVMVLPEDVKVLPEFMDWDPLPEQEAGRP